MTDCQAGSVRTRPDALMVAWFVVAPSTKGPFLSPTGLRRCRSDSWGLMRCIHATESSRFDRVLLRLARASEAQRPPNA
jgi:hypothetical protein